MPVFNPHETLPPVYGNGGLSSSWSEVLQRARHREQASITSGATTSTTSLAAIDAQRMQQHQQQEEEDLFGGINRSPREGHQGGECCAICMLTLPPLPPLPGTAEDKLEQPQQQQQGARAVVLLSCAHRLHAACALGLERFAAMASAATSTSAAPCVCPVCRAPYLKRLL